MHTNLLSGISTVKSFKLFVLAPEIKMLLLLSFLSLFVSEISSFLAKYFEVKDFVLSKISFNSPWVTISPP